jgi:four helix bundle protein
MTIQTFEDVVAWQRGRELYLKLHPLLKNHRDYAYKDQLLRAALSITNNIAEGFDRGSNRELKQFLIISRGSAAEVRSMLLIAKDLDIIPAEELASLMSLVKEVSRLLTGFIKSINNSTN